MNLVTRWRDGVLALVLYGVALLTPDSASAARPLDLRDALLLAAATLPLAARRSRPLIVLGVVAAALIAHGALGYPATGAWLALAVAAYTVAAHRGPRIAFSAVAASAAAALAAPIVANQRVGIDAFLGGLVLFALPTMLGDRVYARRASAAAAVRVERERIARDLHDSVAHALSLMVIQVDAAEAMIERDPARAREALAAIRSTGRQSLGEMRQMLGDLRAGAQRHPQPGIRELPELIASAHQDGVDTELVVEGAARAVTPLIDVAVFRIVQEALTNVRRHAGAAHARVLIRFHADKLHVEITDDGRGTAAVVGGGHGLIGMGERARLCGGQLHAGARPGGGFQVVASLPFGESS